MKRRMVTIMLAALLAVFGIVAVLAYVGKANQRAIEGIKAAPALVANAPIPSGTRVLQALHEKLLTRVRLPTSSVPSDAVPSITTDISNLVTSAAIQPGQLLLREMLVLPRQVTGAIAIPDGMVAVSVEVCLSADVAGYVKPGSHVAVFDTYKNGQDQMEQSCQTTHQTQDYHAVSTRLVLKDMEVLSVSSAPPPSGTTSSNGTVLTSGTDAAQQQGAVFVTLAASQKDAERLIMVQETGLPYFALTTLSSGVTPDTAPVLLFK